MKPRRSRPSPRCGKLAFWMLARAAPWCRTTGKDASSLPIKPTAPVRRPPSGQGSGGRRKLLRRPLSKPLGRPNVTRTVWRTRSRTVRRTLKEVVDACDAHMQHGDGPTAIDPKPAPTWDGIVDHYRNNPSEMERLTGALMTRYAK